MSEVPPKKAKRRGRAPARYEVNGEMLTLKEAADMCSVSLETFKKRMQRHGETVAGAAEYYRKMGVRPRARLTDDERRKVDELAEELFGVEAPADDAAETAERESATDTQKDAFDRETLKVFNRAIDALGELLRLKMFDMEIDREANELVYDLDLKRFEMFGGLVDWNALAKGGKMDV